MPIAVAARRQTRPTPRASSRRSGWPWAAGALVILALFCAPYFFNPRFISLETDWLQYPVRYAFARSAWLAGAPPLWCPYLGGGYFIAGDPDGQTLTLLTPFALVWGEIVGLKAALAAAHVAAFAGMFYLMRRVWGAPAFAAAFAGLLLSLSSWLPGRIFQGNWPEIYYAAAPWLAAFLLRAGRRPRYVLALGLLLGLILPQARQGWAALALFLAALAAAETLRTRRVGYLVAVVAAAAVGLVVGAVKLLPAWALLRHGLPLVAARDLYTNHSIAALHWSRVLSGFVGNEIDLVRHQSSEICIGYAGAGLALVGLFLALRRSWPIGLVGLFFAWLVMAWRAPFDLFHYLHALPVFDKMMNPVRDLNYFMVFSAASLAGLALAALLRRPRLRPLAALAAAVSVGELFTISADYHSLLFTEPPPPRRAGPFEQVYCLVQPRWAQRPVEGNAYFNFLRGAGVVNYHTSLAFPAYVEPSRFVDRWGRSHPNSQYRGEAFALRSGAPARLSLPRPNELRVRVRLPQPDTVVVNQNYNPAWRASEGEIVNWRGRLAVRLPAGGHDVRLTFESGSFWAGAAVSSAAILLCALGLRRRRRARWLAAWPAWMRVERRFALPALAVAAAALGLALRPRVKADELAAAAAKFMAESPDSFGDPLAARARLEEADALLAQAQRLRPRSGTLARLRGTVLLRLGRADAAVAQLRRAARLAPDRADNLVALLRALALTGRGREGEALAARLRGRFPLDWRVHFWSAWLDAEAGRVGEAMRRLYRAVELGLPDERLLETGPPFAAQRGRPAFARLVDAVRARQDPPARPRPEQDTD